MIFLTINCPNLTVVKCYSRSVNDVMVTLTGYVKCFVKIHNLKLKDEQIKCNDTGTQYV